MAIVLDPTKAFVTIVIYYVEERKEHGNLIYHFINDHDQYEEWRSKGYKTVQEVEQEIRPPTRSVEDVKPGRPPPRNQQPPSIDQIIQEKYQGKVIQALSIHCRQLTWKEHNTILAKSVRDVMGKDGPTTDFDPLTYRELKLKAALKGWDAKDDSGQDIKLTPEAIDNLDRTVAEALLYNYEKVCEPSEADLKNS